MKYLIVLLLSFVSLNANILQKAIDNAPSGAILELPSGLYEGNIVINKPITIDGLDKSAHIKGEGKGSVITINSSNVVIKNLTISNSGNNHQLINSAISIVESNYVNIENNHIEDSLFGIDLQKVNRSKLLNNYITSRDVEIGLRGDGIRLWYSHDNQISGNELYKSRDLVVWYASGNIIESNHGSWGRYSLHFMYAGRNIVRDNFFEYNSVGIFFMYSSGTTAIRNTVRNSVGSFGVGIGIKDSSNFVIQDNDIIYNARGLYIDQSPFQPGTTNLYERNNILYNSNGIQFQATRERSIFRNNILKGNMEAIINDTPRNKLEKNLWQRNYWDDYEGFDRNGDGIGDIPYKHYVYADKLWLYNENIRFFYGSVVMELLNFLAQIAPFSEPDLLAIDKEPIKELNFEK